MNRAGKTLTAAAAVAVVLAAAHSAPARQPGSRAWARAFLPAAGLPRTRCNVAAVTAWEHAEGSNRAWRNPLDTTQPEPGSVAVNPAGVQAYGSAALGITATVTTLDDGNYPAIRAALTAGDSARAVADAVSASPWGTLRFTASC